MPDVDPARSKASPARTLPSTDEPRARVAGAPLRARDSADQDFGEAFIHSGPSRTGFCKYRVLGFKLLPHSFWHACLLDYVESPFLGYAGKLDFASLYTAVRICQCSYPVRPQRRAFEYLRELYVARRYTRLFLKELGKFSAYISDYFARPTYVPKSDSKPIHVPWYFYEVGLLKRFDPDRTWSKCWNTPVGEGSWKNITMSEASGFEVSIMTPAQRIAFKNSSRVRKPSAALLARIEEVSAMRGRRAYR